MRQLEQVNIRTGWAEAQTGPYRPYVKDTKKETARDREKGDETEREREMREQKRRPKVCCVRQRVTEGGFRDAAGKASAGLKIEGANDV